MDSRIDYSQCDQIHIRDLRLQAVIGINPEERKKKQVLIFNLSLFTNQRPAATADDFSLTVDYQAAMMAVSTLVESSSYTLIESLAAAVADSLLKIEGVLACRVSVDKPGALLFAKSAAVEIFRTAQNP